MTNGVEFTANYTFSKAIDGGKVAGSGGTFNGTDLALDPRNRKIEYALSDLDQRQRFVGSVVWVPPYAKKLSNPAARMILDGFNFASIVTIATGQPVTGLINGFASGGPDGGVTVAW